MRWFARHSFPGPDAIRAIVVAMSDEPAPIDDEVLDRARKEIEVCQRDEHETLKVAGPDLVRLDRYERRAWSRQKRAVKELMRIKAEVKGPGHPPAGGRCHVRDASPGRIELWQNKAKMEEATNQAKRRQSNDGLR